MGGGRGEAWQGRVVTLGRQTRCLRFDAEIKIARRRQASKDSVAHTHTLPHTRTSTRTHPASPPFVSPFGLRLLLGFASGCVIRLHARVVRLLAHILISHWAQSFSLSPHTLCLCLSLTLLLRRLLPNVVGNCINYSISSVIRS